MRLTDFTKDELQIIFLDMSAYINEKPMLNESPIHKELRNKVLSMIDNYCEHEPSDKYPNEFTWQLCHKCGAQYK